MTDSGEEGRLPKKFSRGVSMPNRRSFITTVTGAAAGLAMSRGLPDADAQVLSINGYWWYAVKDRALADKIVRAADDGLAAWCKQHPTRFVALTSPSLQYPDLAAAQVERAVNQLGHRGASIGGHVEGESLSSPKFDPFWAKLQDLGVPVFMHPGGADNVLKENAWEGSRGDLGNIIGN